MLAATVATGAFLAMEGVSYATHRWVMHGRGMTWHRSHHPPRARGFEDNDRFPAVFACAAIGAFALAAWHPGLVALRWIGIGVSGYGLSYFVAHEVFVHRRLPIELPRWRYLRWLERSHRVHHLFGGEPYGMLLPVVPRELRTKADGTDRDPWGARRDSIRSRRTRL